MQAHDSAARSCKNGLARDNHSRGHHHSPLHDAPVAPGDVCRNRNLTGVNALDVLEGQHII
eukprot:6168136-Prymnesium_polylepis.1